MRAEPIQFVEPEVLTLALSQREVNRLVLLLEIAGDVHASGPEQRRWAQEFLHIIAKAEASRETS